MQRVLRRVRYTGSDPTARLDGNGSTAAVPSLSPRRRRRLLPDLIFVDTFAWANRPECQSSAFYSGAKRAVCLRGQRSLLRGVL